MVSIRYRAGYYNTVFQVYRWLSNNNRLIFGIVIAYLVLSFTLPVSRDFLEWQSGDCELFYVAFQLQFGFTLYPIPVMTLAQAYPKFKQSLDKIFNEKLVITGGISLLGLCLVLTFLHIAGWWWTWLTIGLHLSTALLVYLMLKSRTSPVEAIIIAIGLVGIAIGLWEIPYQIGLKLVHQSELPRAIMIYNLRREVLIELPFILGGIYILIFYRKSHIVNFNKWFIFFSIATIGLYTYWFLSGFWVEMNYNWTTYEWVQNPVDLVSKTIFRASKVTLALALISLLIPRKEKDERLSSNPGLDVN